MLGHAEPRCARSCRWSPATTRCRRCCRPSCAALRPDPHAARDERVLHAARPARRRPGQRVPAGQPAGPTALLRAARPGVGPDLAHFRFRDACGYDGPVPCGARRRRAESRSPPRPDAPISLLDGGRLPGGSPGRAVGSAYGEERVSRPTTRDRAAAADVHLGRRRLAARGRAVHAAAGRASSRAARCGPSRYDFGGIVILRHFTDDGTPFFTLYGHLSRRPAGGRDARDGRRRDRRLGTPGARTAAGSRTCTSSCSRDLVGMGTDVHGRRAPRRSSTCGSRLPRPEPAARAPRRRRGRAARATATTFAGAGARSCRRRSSLVLRASRSHRPRRGRATSTTPTARRSSTWSTTSATSATATRAWWRRGARRWRR